MTAMTMASSIGDDEVVIVDIYGLYGMGLPLVKWGLSLSVPVVNEGGALSKTPSEPLKGPQVWF